MQNNYKYPNKPLEDIEIHLIKEISYFSNRLEDLDREASIVTAQLQKFKYLLEEIQYRIKDEKDKDFQKEISGYGNKI